MPEQVKKELEELDHLLEEAHEKIEHVQTRMKEITSSDDDN
jgi:prefoldin subunit 5